MVVRALEIVVLLVIACCSVSAWPAYSDIVQGKGKEYENVTFPMPTFLNNVSFIEEIKFDLIALNPNLSTDQKNSQLEAWAYNQSDEVFTEYTAYHTDLTYAIAQIIEIYDSRIANQSSEVRDLYETIKDIRLDTNLTSLQQCAEIKEAVKNSTAITFTKLKIAIPLITGDCSVGGFSGVVGSIGSGVTSVGKSIGGFFSNIWNKIKP